MKSVSSWLLLAANVLALALLASSSVKVSAADTAPTLQSPAPEGALTVMTYNIRYDNPGDPNPWRDRRGEVAQLIKSADIIGLQEALRSQIDDLQARLDGYAWFGVGRDDGKNKGEYSCIFYRKDRLEVIRQDTFWLSENPGAPGSKSWDAALTRIATWGQFKDIRSGATFYVINTHFDHRGVVARAESAKLIVRKVPGIAGDAPVIVTGDFNSHEYSAPYTAMVGSLKDARYLSGKACLGPRVTFNNWTELSDQPSPIDYVFVNGKVRVHSAENVGTTFRGLYPSDHLPFRTVVTLSE